MIQLGDTEEGFVIGIPDCGVCGDTGHVECPCTTWRGQLYLGHGPCECHVCRAWPAEMRAWADRRGRLLPAGAVKPEALARSPLNRTLLACRACENGRDFHAWMQTERRIGDHAADWKFHPKGWVWVSARSPQGGRLYALWKEHRGSDPQRSGPSRGLTMADVERLAGRLSGSFGADSAGSG